MCDYCEDHSVWRSGVGIAVPSCIIIFIGGIQLLCVGILGQYLSKVYLETKQRPIYIIKEEQ